MSEELLQTTAQAIGKYEYYKLGSTTLGQLVTYGKITKTAAVQKLLAKKPDGLVIYQSKVIAVVEYKQPSMLKTEKQIVAAIKQEIEVAKALCHILVVTDGSKSFWVNSHTGSYILDSTGVPISFVFHPKNINNANRLEALLDQIRSSITRKNNQLKGVTTIDPTPLAARLWQTIWVATGKSPVKCLYNVVELFIFKFLSDLRVLDSDFAFEKVYSISKTNPNKALEFYAVNTRKEIIKLFPRSSFDGTTIINGTIFVTEDGAPNLTQALLFQRSLEHLKAYAEEFGSLTRIDKQFKTKLYESFLKQEVEALGQYFTPRTVVQSVIRMAGLNDPSYSFADKRFCDPFCGVGGFPLELLNLNEAMKNAYEPDGQGTIKPNFVLHGFDKGFERDDERTIILAKANMLIYTAELLFTHSSCTKEFAKAFNSTFKLFKDNIGTFGHIIASDSDKYDVILSNPPYVTSGSSIIKEELLSKSETRNAYPVNSLGLEGLSMEWIVNSLKPGGRAFVIIPDGILGRVNGEKLRHFILKNCYLDAIVTLPPRTFFSNAELTYVIALTKKTCVNGVFLEQTDPVFTYLASNIGERLTSVRREEVAENDLPEMEKLFKVFMASKASTKRMLESESARCKIQNIESFSKKGSHWVVDRWWSKAERIALGIDKKVNPITHTRLLKETEKLQDGISNVQKASKINFHLKDMKRVVLGDENLFTLSIGERVTKKSMALTQGDIPVYSSNVMEPFGFVSHTSFDAYDQPTIIWGIDGNFNFALMNNGYKFSITDHCGAIRILSKDISAEYLLYALRQRAVEESFDRSFRASLTNMRQFEIAIPIKGGRFDLAEQKRLAKQFKAVDDSLAKLRLIKANLDGMFSSFASSYDFLS